MQRIVWGLRVLGTVGAALGISGLGMAIASATSTATAVWLMSETSGTTMTDSSGYGNNGTTYNVTMTGANGYVFDPAMRSKVVVPDSPALDPGSGTLTYSVTVKSTHAPASGTDYDLLRKGVNATTGGEYKLEIVNVNGQGRAFCLVKDSQGAGARIKGTTNVTDGKVHTLTCTKTASGLTLKVDGLQPRITTVTGGLRAIANTSALMIGAKTPIVTGPAGDWYNGALLGARISVG
jgi:Concanavalin A-like lectin/glucanases superfamily